jgi:DNA mismatch repair protein MutS
MAQAGSFVPASEARVGIVDRVYCRVGASDNLARGESTFLVEMNETAYILHTATEHSLVIMDEVGRGTGTKDGLAIAWAVCEELLDNLKCRTLFATHYHELSGIVHPRMANRSMDVAERNGEIIFLRKLREGPAAESYGLHVASLAGLPEQVLTRAAEIMAGFTGHSQKPAASEKVSAVSSPPAESKILNELKNLDINAMTPLEALNRMQKWKNSVQTGQKPGRKSNAEESAEKTPSLFD